MVNHVLYMHVPRNRICSPVSCHRPECHSPYKFPRCMALDIRCVAHLDGVACMVTAARCETKSHGHLTDVKELRGGPGVRVGMGPVFETPPCTMGLCPLAALGPFRACCEASFAPAVRR